MENPVHIFLADDDADDRALFYEAIRITAPKAVLTTAGNGVEFLEVLSETSTSLPRLIFLDLNMPLKNGHECLLEIRKSEPLKNIPVFIYSTSVNPDDIDKSFNAGADFFIRKPSSFNDLVEIVKALLALKRYEHLPPNRADFVLKTVEAD